MDHQTATGMVAAKEIYSEGGMETGKENLKDHSMEKWMGRWKGH